MCRWPLSPRDGSARWPATRAAIIGIELLAACQGLEFRRPLTTSAPLEEVFARVRAVAPPVTRDRAFAPDIEAAKTFAASDTNHAYVPGLLPSLSE